jgi:hypothetical protein
VVSATAVLAQLPTGPQAGGVRRLEAALMAVGRVVVLMLGLTAEAPIATVRA